jgi:CheY-like chemotaxis protein
MLGDDKSNRARPGNRRRSFLEGNLTVLPCLSHEVRTPLHGIIGATNLLIESGLTAQQGRLAQTVLVNSEALLSLVDNILKLSAIQSGQVQIQEVEFNLLELVEEVLDLFATTADAKCLELVSLMTPGMPACFYGDRFWLRQVLINLVANALKFTEVGEVVVRATLADTAGRSEVVRFEVSDTGPGILPEGQGRLFQPFASSQSSTIPGLNSSGLGLAISKRLLQLMRGDIGYESAPGQGSVFWFTVPLRPSVKPNPAWHAAEMPLHSLRVLVVYHNQRARLGIQQQITALGATSDAAGTSEEALELLCRKGLRGDPYRLVLADVRSPVNGLALAQTVKSDLRLRTTQFVLLSPVSQTLKPDQLEQAGVDHFLTKPVKSNVLRECLLATAANRLSRTHLAQRDPKLRILLAEDNDVSQRVILAQLQHLGWTADLAGDGDQVIGALEHGTYDVILLDCHMPGLDGYQTVQRIRSRECQCGAGGRRTYIIALTADNSRENEIRCRAAGMDDWLAKPIRNSDLERSLRKRLCTLAQTDPGSNSTCLRTSLAGDVDAKANAPRHVFDLSLPPLDLDHLLEAAGGRQDEARALLEVFLLQARQILSSLRPAVQNRNLERIHLLAHKLAGSSASCGATSMLGPLQELEHLARCSALSPREAEALLLQTTQACGQVEAYLNSSLGNQQAACIV